MPETNERRYVRVKCNSSLHFSYRGQSHNGILYDISLCGAFVATSLAVETGEKVRLDTSLPTDGAPPLTLRGRIVRLVRPGGGAAQPPSQAPEGFGVDFAALPISTREAIDEYVRRMFRAFRKLQFELSRDVADGKAIQELIAQTYLPRRTYSRERLQDIVAAELKNFRLRPV